MDRPDHNKRNEYRLNLDTIESTLIELQCKFTRINKSLVSHREHFSEEMLANMVSAYTFIDIHIAEVNNLFAPGNLKHLIELNLVVLCGTNSAKRKQFTDYLEANDNQFYDQTSGGIRDIIEWYEMHRRESVWMRAAGVYIRMLSHPQLYIEGNHRTGALIMSYLLGREGKPPFVLSVDNAKTFFDITSLIKKTKRNSIIMRFRMPRLKRYLAKFLQKNVDRTHLFYEKKVID